MHWARSGMTQLIVSLHHGQGQRTEICDSSQDDKRQNTSKVNSDIRRQTALESLAAGPGLTPHRENRQAIHAAASSVSHVISALGTVMDARSRPFRHLGRRASSIINGCNFLSSATVCATLDLLPCQMCTLYTVQLRTRLSRPCFVRTHNRCCKNKKTDKKLYRPHTKLYHPHKKL